MLSQALTQDELTQRLERLRLRHRVPALAAAVVTRQGPATCEVTGVADLSTGRRAELATVFAWYSLTKVITATACVRELAAAGVPLDTRMVEVLPGLAPDGSKRQRARWEAMTVRHLVSHAAGFGDLQLHAAAWFLDPETAWPDPRTTLAAVLARRDWLTRPPGARFRYTNLGYAVLGEVLSEVTGVPFRQLVVDRVLRPIGARHADFRPAGGDDVARGHVRRWTGMGLLASALGGFTEGRVRSGDAGSGTGAGAGDTALPGTWLNVKARRPVFSPHGGLWGPMGDLVPVLREHLEAGFDPDHPLAGMQAVHTPRRGRARLHGEGGLGWVVHTGPPRRVSHGGRGPGFTAEMVVLPEAGLAAAVLGNATFDAKAVVSDLLRGGAP